MSGIQRVPAALPFEPRIGGPVTLEPCQSLHPTVLSHVRASVHGRLRILRELALLEATSKKTGRTSSPLDLFPSLKRDEDTLVYKVLS